MLFLSVAQAFALATGRTFESLENKKTFRVKSPFQTCRLLHLMDNLVGIQACGQDYCAAYPPDHPMIRLD